MRINSNPTASAAFNSLNVANDNLSKSIEKLSSGSRINRAADDAAGLVSSEKLLAQINGTKVGLKNAQDGVSVVQVADGALNEIGVILQRARDLAAQNVNDAQNDDAKTANATEYKQLLAEVNRIVGTTSFGNKTLLDGSYNATFGVGQSMANSDLVNISITAFDAVALLGSTYGSIGTPGATTIDAAAVAQIDTAITSVANGRALLGAQQNRFEHTINNLNSVLTNFTSARSRIADTDMAAEMSNLTKQQVLSQAATSMLAQANQAPQSVLKLLG